MSLRLCPTSSFSTSYFNKSTFPSNIIYLQRQLEEIKLEVIIKHKNKEPRINKTAYIAPNAVICGDVRIGKNARIMFGAQIIAESQPIIIGENCIVLENAVVRGTGKQPVTIGNNCLIGPNAHLAGCTIEDNVFIATGASVFHEAVIKKGVEIRINGVVHLKTVVPENTTVPINWIAAGNPMQLFTPDQHEELWKVQKPLNFPKTVYGIERPSGNNSIMPDICEVMVEKLGGHLEEEII